MQADSRGVPEAKDNREKSAGAKPAYLVPAVDRAFRILDLLKSEGREMTLMEIAKVTVRPADSSPGRAFRDAKPPGGDAARGRHDGARGSGPGRSLPSTEVLDPSAPTSSDPWLARL